jgi:hypothetical protein
MKKTLWWLAALLAVMVLAGCDPEPEEDNKALTLKVTGINVSINGASLQPSTDTWNSSSLAFTRTGGAPTPSAVDTEPTDDGVFSFMGMRWNTEKNQPEVTGEWFTTAGQYYIVLQISPSTGPQNSGPRWVYVGNTANSETPITRSFPDTKTITIPFSHFWKYREQ